MTFTIAIQPERAQLLNGRREWSDHWIESVRAAGHVVRPVDLRAADPLRQLDGCDALLWRFSHAVDDYTVAQRLLPIIEKQLGLLVYPDYNTCWHYDDKIAQVYLFDALGIPTPRTWIFWQVREALEFCRQAQYPLVAKLSRGASSANVMLVRNRDQAERLVGRLFGRGVRQLDAPERAPWGQRIKNAARWLARGHEPMPWPTWVLHKDYAYFQEFLPDNGFDTRVTVIGEKALGFRRLNRPNDFRASGSGRVGQDPQGVDPRFIRLAFRIARQLNMQSCSIDGLYRAGEPCIGEVSYTNRSQNLFNCPGQWTLDGDWDSGELRWQPGHAWPQDLVLTNLLQRLEQQRTAASV